MNWLKDFLPKDLPSSWTTIEEREDGAAYVMGVLTIAPTDWMTNKRAFLETVPNLAVIVTGASELDGRRWLHLCVARPKHRPSYGDMVAVKHLFLGDRLAFQIYPDMASAINAPVNCSYLFHCIDGQPLPIFSTQLAVGSVFRPGMSAIEQIEREVSGA